MIVIICKRCGQEFEVKDARGLPKYCNECKILIRNERKREKDFLKNQKKLLEGVEDVDYVIDRWNGFATTCVNGPWFKKYHPDRTIEEYKQEFPDAKITCEKTSKKLSEVRKEIMSTPEMKKFYSEKIKGDKNPNAKCNTTLEERQRKSPFSKNFKNYDGLSDEEKDERIHENLQSDRDDRTTSQVKYWTNRGYSEVEAKEIISERQKTFTLEKCIEKYGEERGLEMFKNRQLKWQSNFKHLNYSKISQELFWTLYGVLDDECYFAQNNNGVKDESGKNHELRIKTSNSVVSLDFYYPKNNSIIEFDGDYWHTEERDIERDKSLNDVGYTRILHIKECDYRENKDLIIKKCIDFLLNNITD